MKSQLKYLIYNIQVCTVSELISSKDLNRNGIIIAIWKK